MHSQGGQAISDARRPRVCIATAEITGPFRNGGIATSYTALAHLLAKADWDVTVLYLSDDACDRFTMQHWVGEYARAGVKLVPLPPQTVPTAKSPLLIISYRVYEYLKQNSFDVVHFHEWMGAGFYALGAKRQGLRFLQTFFCVGVHSPTLWLREANEEFVSSIDDYEADALERYCVASADAVWFPSDYLRQWTLQRDWKSRGEVFVRSHASNPKDAEATFHSASAPVDEFVFFGRLETRKGVALFCDAIEHISGDLGPSTPTITFLGKPALILGVDASRYLAERAARWSFHWNVQSNFTSEEATNYLRRPGRLAVMPSLTENLPLVVAECLRHRIPFVASGVGGVPEMIDARDRARVLFAPYVEALAEKLREAVHQGARPARPAGDGRQVDQQWVQWHDSKRDVPMHSTPRADVATPMVSVCLTHFDRPEYLRQAVASLERQDYPNFEVVLVDDGSKSPQAQAALLVLEKTFAARGWRIVRQENRYLGAARNAAARSARGDYLLFMDDDNLAKPGEIQTMVTAAETSGADVVGSLMDVFEGNEPPADDAIPAMRWLFPPADLSLGALRNCFGDANALVRRDAFLRMGGFTEDVGVTHEDWEFFAKAFLAGLRFEMIAEPLFWYRFTAGSMLRATSDYRNHARSLRPYLERTPPELRPLIHLAQGQNRKIEQLSEQVRQLEERLSYLRYRVMDRVNRAVKRIPWLHPVLKRAMSRGRPRVDVPTDVIDGSTKNDHVAKDAADVGLSGASGSSSSIKTEMM